MAGHFRSVLPFTLSLLLVFLTLDPALVIAKCAKLDSSCTCYSDLSGQREVQCGGSTEAPAVRAELKPGNALHVQCSGGHNTTPADLKLLKNLEAGALSRVFVEFCPLPEPSLSKWFEDLGLKLDAIKYLSFKSHHHPNAAPWRSDHFKGLSGVNWLELADTNHTGVLPEDLLQGMPNVTNLYLRGNGIMELPKDLLRTVPKLAVLELGNNQISEIPEGFFNNLTSLKLLNLWDNKLATLTGATFASLPDLENLDLLSNGLENLSEDLFYSVPNLKVINLSSNNFTSLPPGLLKKAKKLVTFKMQNNKAPKLELPEGMFSDLPHLRELFLVRCAISEIPSGLLKGSSNLSNLTLMGNKLTSLPVGLFEDTKNLSLLDASSNNLEGLTRGVFSGLNQLRVLRLANNQIKAIPDGLLLPLGRLEELDLRRNTIFEIEESAFDGVRQLRVLKLDHNHISFSSASSDAFGISSPLHGCTQMEELTMSNNSLTEIPTDCRFIMLKLRKLDLSYNNFSQISVLDMHFLADQLAVDLRHNHITEIEMAFSEVVATAQEFSPVRSVQILLGHNPLDCGSCNNYHLFRYRENCLSPRVRQLVSLDLSDLACSTSGPFPGASISQVSSDNFTCAMSAEKCPTNCSACTMRPAHRALTFHCCHVPTELPSVGGFNRTELVQENCHLQEAPNIYRIRGNTSLTGLYLGGNNFAEFRGRNYPNNIEVLELHSNNLTRLTDNILRRLENSTTLRRLTLSGNPWECDCDTRGLLAFVQSHFTLVPDLANVTCADGRLLNQISASDLCAGAAKIAVAASIAIAAAGILLGAAAALYYRYQQEIKVWLYARNLCLWFVTEEELDKDKKYDAFVSYSHKDEGFVVEHLVPGLEPPFKLCIHVRDWVAGDWIPEQIARSVEQSRRTLVVLSPSFIESVWGRLEFRAAHQQALSEGRTRVIVILLEDVGPMDTLDPELRAYLTMNTYVQWGDPWFWDKLRYALPHRSDLGTGWRGRSTQRVGASPSALALRIEDKLEMMRAGLPPPTAVVTAPPTSTSLHTPPAATEQPSTTQQNGAANGHVKVV